MRTTGARIVQHRSGKSVGRIDLAGSGRGRSGYRTFMLHAATLPLKYNTVKLREFSIFTQASDLQLCETIMA